jgi:hypothetical protein
MRVACYSGYGPDLRVDTFGSPPDDGKGADFALYGEYVAPGILAPAGTQGGAN